MKLTELIAGLEDRGQRAEDRRPERELEIKGLAYDSRDVEPGYVFVARRGASKYVDEAIKNGAIFLVLEEAMPISVPNIIVEDARKSLSILAQGFYGNPSKQLKVIGITGTFGKTTSTWLIKSIYESAGIRTGLIGTIEYKIGGKSIPAHHTTPESLELQSIFSDLLQGGTSAVVMEVSSHGIALERVYGIDFDIAGFTMLDRDHLDFHKTIEEYKDTKLKFFTDLKSDGIAVLNRDDRYFNEFKSKIKAKVITYGTSEGCDVMGKVCSVSENGIELIITYEGKECKIRSPLIGSYHINNLLLASACALSDGIEFASVCKGIGSLNLVPGRFERIGRVIIDYAHTPGALKSALTSAREMAKGRVICIFGCGGDRDQGKRSEMGKIASQLADYVILTTDNPRSEDPKLIIEDIIKGISPSNYDIVLDRRDAIRKGVERSSPEDIVLLVGKGHENYQIYGEIKVPWDDRAVAKEIMKELGIES
ncbi:MAG: UDP-N-acetylmuramoyl-L-alanyl-D-glutamate--2,6-diaminopimelate ligase [Candidatus Stahlbacteria bacterium]|nr:UDP-N-acetylmuramoyl-L-alanyl-D-glutamate--2,6-diaminopimelate ligase [Candidatus Stahlbacteria bacterium]